MESKARVREQVEDPQRLIRVHEAATDPHPVYTTDAEATAIATTVSAASVATHEAAADPHTGYQKESEKNAANGYCGLDAGVLVPVARLPVATTTTAGATTLGTSADGVSGKVVQTDDTRLTDARTPIDNSCTNAKLADMAQSTIKGRAAGAGTGDPVDLTPAQVVAIISDTITTGDLTWNGGENTLLGWNFLPAATDPPVGISIGVSLEFSGASLQRAALTGDVTATANGNTTTIANDAVTLAKMANLATDRLIGRDTAGTGDPEALTVGGGVEFTGSGGIQRSALTGDVTATAGSNSTTIANDAVTNAKMANVATQTFKGRTTAGTGDPEDLTAAQARTVLSVQQQNSDTYMRLWDDYVQGYTGVSNSASGAGAGWFHAQDHINATENAFGEVGVQTGTTATGRSGLYYAPHDILLGNSTAWNLEARIATHSGLSTVGEEYVCTIGFSDTIDAAGEPTDGAYFVYRRLTDGDFWVCVTRSNSVETKTVTATVPAYTNFKLFRIEVASDGSSCVFKIDGTTVATHTTNIPTGAGRLTGIGWKIEKSAGTTTRYMYADYYTFEASRSSAR